MDSLIELIIAGVIILVSTIWNKGTGAKDSATDADVSAIEDFFKQSRRNSPASAGGPGAVGGADKSRSRSQQRKDRKKQQETANRPNTVPPSQHVPQSQMALQTAGAGDDEFGGSSLVSYENKPSEARRTTVSRDMPKRVSRFKLSRNEVLNAFVLSEVMTRYDLNRIYSRIPAVRKD
jgi:hypothetical protein